METNYTFRISEWIGCQRSWAIALSAHRKIAAQQLLILQELEHNLLSPYLLNAQMLKFLLPLQISGFLLPEFRVAQK
jgi:hypothetical protein